ncbi:MAG: HAMP domain-containing histidine kinase [Comamonadaceae bacterium]|nr:MAG: HAMP domain-containing histidine kinase [Comamonadaceae bacterium]
MGSFRQLLLVAFLMIAALLGGTALRAVFILDELVLQGSAGAARALELNGAAQSLAARTVAMERAARQSLILSDAVLRKRFDEESTVARATLAQMVAGGVKPDEAARWTQHVDAISALMDGPSSQGLIRERAAAGAFRELDLVNGAITAQVQALIEGRNRELQEQLDASRARLTQQVVLVIAFAVALAFALGIWLSRPFRKIEKAIVQLGENRLEDPIDIRGPTDVRGVSQRLEWLRLRLTELEADKSRFLRHVSHELKTPLAALREGVALLEDEVTGELNTSQREIARILYQNTAALQRQIEALLRFNAAAFEATQLRREPTDIPALLHRLVQDQQLQWQSQGLHVVVEGGPMVLQADPEKLGTAMANVLSNAIRFSPREGTIRLSVSRSGAWAFIDIADQGPGVAPADVQRIFEPFYRGERQPVGGLPGTGIGLSIVVGYIEAHGGEVELLSDAAGATFRIKIPA